MPTTFSSSGATCRASTAASHYRAIERVILAMRERLDEPLSLDDLAEIAIISPYHFDRVFRQVVGIPPCQFLGALRIEAAKKLLLTSRLSVTEVCFEVGYNSLGTFTTRFTNLVGLPPSRLRSFAQRTISSALDLLHRHGAGEAKSEKTDTFLSGAISAPDDFEGLIFVGLFSSPIPQNRPISCTLLTASGFFHLPMVPDGCYYLFAAAIAGNEWPLPGSITNSTSLQVGSGNSPLIIEDGHADGSLDLVLRSLQLTDPPLLVALQFLLDDLFSSDEIIDTPQQTSPYDIQVNTRVAAAARASLQDVSSMTDRR